MPHTDLKDITSAYMQADLIFSEAEVERALHRVAMEATDTLLNSNPLVLSVHHGGMVVMGKLLTRLVFPLETGCLLPAQASTPEAIQDWHCHSSADIAGRTVLLIHETLDRSSALTSAIQHCREQGAAEIHVVGLIHTTPANGKSSNTTEEAAVLKGLQINKAYVGLETEATRIFGCGIDYKGYWRNAPGIFALTD